MEAAQDAQRKTSFRLYERLQKWVPREADLILHCEETMEWWKLHDGNDRWRSSETILVFMLQYKM